MKNFVRKFSKQSRGEKGFTLIELLIVIAVLGILAAVIIPNVAGFITSGKIGAANAEVGALNTAFSAYCAEHSITNSAGEAWDAATTALNLGPYLSKPAKYTYTVVAGVVTGDGSVAPATTDKIAWDGGTLQWKRAP